MSSDSNSDTHTQPVASLEVCYAMDKGLPPTQQDALLVNGEVHQSRALAPVRVCVGSPVLLGIADGVAASPKAEQASRAALLALADLTSAHPDWSYDGLVGARHVRGVQQHLAELAGRRRLQSHASTTLVAVHIDHGRFVVVNVGDSRAYLRKSDGTVRLLSRDHSELNRLIESGEADPNVEYASFYAALSDCLVAHPDAEDFAVHHQTGTLELGDLLLICSDGVHDVLPRGQIESLIAQASDPTSLVPRVMAAVALAGAADNYSLCVIKAHAP